MLDQLLPYLLLFAGGITGLLLALAETRETGPRCDCGRPATRLMSDGRPECDTCTRARLHAAAPGPRQ